LNINQKILIVIENLQDQLKFLKKSFKYLPKGTKLPKRSQIAKNGYLDMVEYFVELKS
jgi:hypothetical protein